MSKTKKIIISVVVVVVIVLIGIFIISKINNNKAVKGLNELLSDEAVQNKVLTEVIEDSVKDLNLGKNGEYRLKVQADNIVNLLTKELLLDQSFLGEIEVESNSPVEIYALTYDYDDKTMQLNIRVTGMYSDLDTNVITYQLLNKNNEVEFKKIDSKVIPYTGETNNGDTEESVVYVEQE